MLNRAHFDDGLRLGLDEVEDYFNERETEMELWVNTDEDIAVFTGTGASAPERRHGVEVNDTRPFSKPLLLAVASSMSSVRQPVDRTAKDVPVSRALPSSPSLASAAAISIPRAYSKCLAHAELSSTKSAPNRPGDRDCRRWKAAPAYDLRPLGGPLRRVESASCRPLRIRPPHLSGTPHREPAGRLHGANRPGHRVRV